MIGLLKRGDLDALLKVRASTVNLPAHKLGFDLECIDHQRRAVVASYEGDGAITLRCPFCNSLVARIAVAEGRGQEDSELETLTSRVTKPLHGGRN